MNKDWLWRPSLIVFISNACVMTLELVAGRIIAPQVGVSLYTWTSVIGVILAGMSIGNFVGGKIADRFASRRTLGILFGLAGLGSLSILVTVSLIGDAGLPVISGLPLVVRMALFVAVIFLVPSALLGTISPLVIKLTLQDLSKTGNVVGRIYAASALGSILGTFATGYGLIQWFGARAILLGIGVILLAMALLTGQWARDWRKPAAASAVLVLAALLLPLQPILAGPCLRETNYYCIKIREETRDNNEVVRTLILDRLVHSYTSLTNPRKLVYGYEKASAEVLEYLSGRDGRVDAFFIGGGGYTLPKYVAAVFPGSPVEVAEIDPGVTAIAQQQLGLPADGSIQSFNEDARLYLRDLDPRRRYTIVFGDAFNDFSVPYHLTTLEFDRLVRQHLTDDGIYVLNLIDGSQRPFVGAFLRTLKQVFGYVYFIPTSQNWKDVVRNTYVILASPSPIDTDRLRQAAGGDTVREINTWLVPQDQMEQVMQNGAFLLTDDYAPTDNLLAPMFEASAR